MDTLASIHKTSIQLLLNEPFYGHYLLGLNKEVSSQCDTAAVVLDNANNIKLTVNPVFWQELSAIHKLGLLKHELLHLVFGHLTLVKDFSNFQLFNIAADITVNQHISPEQLPEGGITLERFNFLKLSLKKNMDVGYYYNALSKAFSKKESENHLLPIIKNAEKALKRHSGWHKVATLNSATVRIIQNQLDNNLREVAIKRSSGQMSLHSLPKALVSLIEKQIQFYQTQVDWRKVLRLFVAQTGKSFIKNTVRRPSKRYGTTPGIRLKRQQRLLIAIDTSSSVSDGDIATFFLEINRLWKQGIDITVVECDTTIRKVYPYLGQKPPVVHGRGGTDFSPPVNYSNKVLKPDGIIYFTDGFANAPKQPSNKPLLWVISSNGIDEENGIWDKLQGRKIKLSH